MVYYLYYIAGIVFSPTSVRMSGEAPGGDKMTCFLGYAPPKDPNGAPQPAGCALPDTFSATSGIPDLGGFGFGRFMGGTDPAYGEAVPPLRDARAPVGAWGVCVGGVAGFAPSSPLPTSGSTLTTSGTRPPDPATRLPEMQKRRPWTPAYKK